MFDVSIFNEIIKTNSIGKEFLYFKSINSTNTYLKELTTNNLKNGLVVFADEQISGYGRFTRKWESNFGDNLLFSVLVKNDFKNNLSILPLSISLAIANAIENYTQQKIETKWPNDLLINGKKVSGVLIENKQSDYLIIGVGVNVNQKNFGSDLEIKATSISNEINQLVNREELLAIILFEIETILCNLKVGNKDNILDNWIAKSRMFGKTIAIKRENEVIFGTAISVNSDGMLVIENLNGQKEIFSSGEITLNTN